MKQSFLGGILGSAGCIETRQLFSLATSAWAALSILLSPIHAARAGSNSDVIAPLVRGNLVILKGNQLEPYPDRNLKGIKYYAIYYAAYWCPDCRAYTPTLVKFYTRMKALHPDFELLFVSMDTDATSMSQYMNVMAMPWPAVSYEAGGGNPDHFQGPGIRRFASNFIPELVLVDAKGRIIDEGGSGEGATTSGKAQEAIEEFLSESDQ